MFNIAINKYYRFLTLAFLLTSLALIISTRHAYALKNTKPQETSQMLQVKTGDTVYSILQKKGFSEKAIAAFLTNPDIPKKITLTSETKYKFSQSPKSQFKSIKFYELDEDVSYYLEQSNNSIVAKKITEHFTKKIKSAQGKVNGSIIGSLERKINNKSISYRFLDAYAFKHNLKKELKRNAFFSIVYEEKYDGDFYIKPGEVLKTQIEINGDIETRHFVSYKDGGSFLSTQPILSDRPFYAPVNYVRISSYFNPRRFHPIRKRRIPHLG
ncbi:MAG: hypothetical protein KDD50_08380, partial [Bdellovibrionales bacterium]|nr:hypothetical protein [Bdellovibrionales bacterium]